MVATPGPVDHLQNMNLGVTTVGLDCHKPVKIKSQGAMGKLFSDQWFGSSEKVAKIVHKVEIQKAMALFLVCMKGVRPTGINICACASIFGPGSSTKPTT